MKWVALEGRDLKGHVCRRGLFHCDCRAERDSVTLFSMRYLPWTLYFALLGLSVTCAVIYRHASELERGAVAVQGYDSRRAHLRMMPEQVLRSLPPLPREQIDSACSKEGGDTLGRNNCYHAARIWMRQLAREQRARQQLAVACGGLIVVVASLHTWIRRRNRAQEARMRTLQPD